MKEEFSILHIAILRNVKTSTRPTRDSIIREVSWDGPWSRKDVQQALAWLRDQEYVYRVSDGWYQTDLSV